MSLSYHLLVSLIIRQPTGPYYASNCPLEKLWQAKRFLANLAQLLQGETVISSPFTTDRHAKQDGSAKHEIFASTLFPLICDPHLEYVERQVRKSRESRNTSKDLCAEQAAVKAGQIHV